MIDPVLSGVWSEWEMVYGIFVDFVIEVEKNTEAGVCEDGMCGFGKNVKV